MTAQQKSGLHSIVQTVASIAACTGIVFLIMQVGEFKGTIEQKLVAHEQRITKNEAAISVLDLRLDDHIASDLQRQEFARVLKKGE